MTAAELRRPLLEMQVLQDLYIEILTIVEGSILALVECKKQN